MPNRNGGKAKPLLITVILLALVFILAAWVWLKSEGPYVMPVKWVRVKGAEMPAQQQAVRNALLPLVKQGFLSLSITSIKQRLLDIPWIANATVQRVWPDTLIVDLQGKIPVAKSNNE